MQIYFDFTKNVFRMHLYGLDTSFEHSLENIWKYSNVEKNDATNELNGNFTEPTKILLWVENWTFISNFPVFFFTRSDRITSENSSQKFTSPKTFEFVRKFVIRAVWLKLQYEKPRNCKWWQVWKRDETLKLCFVFVCHFRSKFQYYWTCVCVLFTQWPVKFNVPKKVKPMIGE